MWGFIINGIQASALEWKGMKEVPWNGEISTFIVIVTIIMATWVSDACSLSALYSWPPRGIYVWCVIPLERCFTL